jgi:predicted DNA-binding antitoxin AbrB/MazE fold protein
LEDIDMVAANSMKVEAVFEDGVFRPALPVALPPHQRVTLIVQLPEGFQGDPQQCLPVEEADMAELGDYFPHLTDYEERLARGEIQWQL